MSSESKPTGADAAEREAAEALTKMSKPGNQAQVESEEEEDDDAPGPSGTAQGDEAAEGEAEGSKKKKKSKRKKKGKESDVKKAIDRMSPQQIQDLLSLNPSLSRELLEGKADAASGGDPAGLASSKDVADRFKSLKLDEIMTGLASSGKNAKDMASYKFWSTQPVPKFGEEAGPAKPDFEEGPIKKQKVEDIPAEPEPLAVEGFEWVTVDLENDEQIKEVYELLNGHYVEDDEAMFRFNYSTSILRWALMSPGWRKDWHIGIRATTKTRKLLAFIAAIPVELRVRDKILKSSEVNFICVHKGLRGKRLAPVLIKEITRLINRQDIWQAIYTAGVVLPKPVSTCRYYHRAINWQKLYEIGFSPLPHGSKPAFQVRKYALPDQTTTRGLREMQARDVPKVQKLLERYLKRYELAPAFNEEEVRHWLLHDPEKVQEQVVWSYVVENDQKKITDFFSFYSLESTVIRTTSHKVVRAAYLFYYATETGLTTPSVDMKALKTRLNQLMGDALILSKRYKFDVFNALSLMDNGLFLEQQKFGAGDGQLHFYLFNYRAHPIAGGVNKKNQLDEDRLSGVGFVML